MIRFASVLDSRYNIQWVTNINNKSFSATEFEVISNGEFIIINNESFSTTEFEVMNNGEFIMQFQVFSRGRIGKQRQRIKKGGRLKNESQRLKKVLFYIFRII